MVLGGTGEQLNVRRTKKRREPQWFKEP